MRYHLYVNIVQFLINSCVIIMGGQTPHNATGSGGGVSSANWYVADALTTMTAAIDDGSASVSDLYEQNIALSADGAVANSNVSMPHEMGKYMVEATREWEREKCVGGRGWNNG